MRKVVEWQGLLRGEQIFLLSAGGNGRNKTRGSVRLWRRGEAKDTNARCVRERNYVPRSPITMVDKSGDERRLSPAKKILDHRAAVHEAARQVWKRCLADDNQQRDAVLHDGIELIRLVADAAIVRECDPARAYRSPPAKLVRRIVRRSDQRAARLSDRRISESQEIVCRDRDR